jgi:hypothetical protein
VAIVEEFGADAYVFCAAEVAGEQVQLVARTDPRTAPDRGARVSLRPLPGSAHLFDPETGERIPR